MIEGIDWPSLDGQRVRVEVSASNIVLELKDGLLLKIAVVMQTRERPAKSPELNGAEEAQVPVEEAMPLTEG